LVGPVGLPLELAATPIAIAATATNPISTISVELSSAWWTPAGLPGASGAVFSAATATEDASKLADKIMAVNARIKAP
jgi:hypothetical protein